MLNMGPPHDSNFAYAYAKRMLDIHSRCYRLQYQRNYICIIPTNIYGPYDNFSLDLLLFQAIHFACVQTFDEIKAKLSAIAEEDGSPNYFSAEEFMCLCDVT